MFDDSICIANVTCPIQRRLFVLQTRLRLVAAVWVADVTKVNHNQKHDLWTKQNRKRFYVVKMDDKKKAVLLYTSGICSATKIFINVSISTPGSRNDCRAL